MLMRQFRFLVIHLLALSVLADTFALKRDQRTSRTQSSDSGQDLTPSGTAAQHITKIPRTKTKVQSKTTEKPTETLKETTTVEDDVTTKEPAEGMNEIGGKTKKLIESLPKEHGPGNDKVRTNVATNRTNNATLSVNGTVENTAPTESTSVTNNETKEPEDPNWIPEAVINSDISTDNVTVSITSVDSETHYSTASVKENEGTTTSTDEETRQQIISGNVSETDNSVSALVAEYTKNYTLHEATTEEPFRPYQGHISKDESNHELSSQDHKTFENNLTENSKKNQENTTLEQKNYDTELPAISTSISTDSNTQSRSTDWLRRSNSDFTTSETTGYMKYNKVISKEERLSPSELANYGDKLEPSSTTSSSVSKENEGPLDDVSMETSNTWRREDTAVVTSMRGGYLNHSTDIKRDASTKSDVIKPDEENESMPTKHTQAIAEQSLMVDDQIKEEFLMEDRLSDKAQFSQGEDRPLSVKPIGKNNALYTVSPNYKPMKKLDVVPGKPQLRNPDDNSWRNQSLNNLGIVFKGNNSSKPFTQVLKNKTETELGNLVEKEEKPEAPELRERLEKLAEERKSKKKKTDKSGESTDYDEASNNFYRATTAGSARIASGPPKGEKATQSPLKKIFKTYDYENTDDDVEYVTLPYLDLKKSPTTKSPDRGTRFPTTGNWAQPTTKQIPGRKATVQYFPPKVYVKKDTEDDEFHRKMQAFAPEQDAPITTANLVIRDKEVATKALRTNIYLPDTPKPDRQQAYRVPVDKAYSFRDIMTRIGHDDDYDRQNEYTPVHKVKEALTQRHSTPIRKEVIEKFIQNYDDNSRKFRVDYPVVYNSRVFHTDGIEVPLASSSASMMQQYSGSNIKHILEQKKKYDPNCEKVVELSADYELHYYMPDQEEKLEFGKLIR